jgi:predicted ABC-type ATPase
MADERPALWLIAGPNGVGKTTWARRYLRAVAGIFCILPDVELALRRIADRVAAGGHAVAEADARRRFPRALADPGLLAELPVALRAAVS